MDWVLTLKIVALAAIVVYELTIDWGTRPKQAVKPVVG